MTGNNSPLQEIICCIGLPASGNPSQFVLERVAQAAGLDVKCLTVDVERDRLGDAIIGSAAMGFRGLMLSDELSRAAFDSVVPENPATESLAAVDVICRDGDRLIGAHSLVWALSRWLGEAEPMLTSAVVLGKNRGAQAAACALAKHGCGKITFAGVVEQDDTLHSLCQRLSSETVEVAAAATMTPAEIEAASHNAIVIDAAETPAERPRGFDPTDLPASATFIQLDLDPQTPSWDRSNRDAPAHLSGLDVLILRYATAFEALTGTAPDRSTIRESLEEFFLI